MFFENIWLKCFVNVFFKNIFKNMKFLAKEYNYFYRN